MTTTKQSPKQRAHDLISEVEFERRVREGVRAVKGTRTLRDYLTGDDLAVIREWAARRNAPLEDLHADFAHRDGHEQFDLEDDGPDLEAMGERHPHLRSLFHDLKIDAIFDEDPDGPAAA